MKFTSLKSKLIVYLVLSFLGISLLGGVLTWMIVDTMAGPKLVTTEELAPLLPAKPNLSDYSTDGYRNDAYTAAEAAYDQAYKQIRDEQQAIKDEKVQATTQTREIIGGIIVVVLALAYTFWCYRGSIASIALNGNELKIRLYNKKETIYRLDQIAIRKVVTKVYAWRNLFIPRRYYDIEMRNNENDKKPKEIINLSLFAKVDNEELFRNL